MKKTLAMFAAAGLAAGSPALGQEAITAEGPEGHLAGTLIAPQDGQPVVLIIPGSGPTDRDGNNPMGVTASSYRLLAEALGERGIGSVRIDKRGMFGSAGAIPDANDVTIAAYADDVHAWIASAMTTTGAECVWVLGHSEGGLVALEAAQRPEGICGVLLVASMGRKTGTILREQLQANPANAPILDQALEAIDTLEAGGTVDVTGMHPALMGLFAPQVQGFLKDMMARDPAELASSVEVPMLVVSGGKDIQTPPADGLALAEAQPEAVYVEIADMNHVLKTVTGEGRAANLATYADPSKPVTPELVGAIADFVTNKE
ncbi:alpha/beta hydrolase [Qipengyuania aquimaris]|uniref:alpha/beta hydrolase n=1 Tax=Qipengyuania aquimaris TaxID=255984 RepID=UPI001FD58822|nr:alpha/beta fold hydrolase [Qipengyuania aquimaris]UOR15886.1 alpha/beta hydrolase [Qipengyuania aquimaris]